MPVVLYLHGLCHLHLSRPAHLKTSYPAIKTPRKLYASWPRAPAVNARAKGPLGFPTNAGKRRAEDSDAEAGKRKRGRAEERKKREGSPRKDEGGDRGGLQNEEREREERKRSLLLRLRLPRSC